MTCTVRGCVQHLTEVTVEVYTYVLPHRGLEFSPHPWLLPSFLPHELLMSLTFLSQSYIPLFSLLSPWASQKWPHFIRQGILKWIRSATWSHWWNTLEFPASLAPRVLKPPIRLVFGKWPHQAGVLHRQRNWARDWKGRKAQGECQRGRKGALRAQIFLAAQLLPPSPDADLPGYH